MSLLEDVFLEDEAGEAQELERVIEGDEFDDRPRTPDSNSASEKEDEAGKKQNQDWTESFDACCHFVVRVYTRTTFLYITWLSELTILFKGSHQLPVVNHIRKVHTLLYSESESEFLIIYCKGYT